MFLNEADFPAITALSEVWTDIRAELLALSAQYFISWPEKSIYDGNWTVFPLYKFGVKDEEHAALCPKTIAAIERVPGIAHRRFLLAGARHLYRPAFRLHQGSAAGTSQPAAVRRQRDPRRAGNQGLDAGRRDGVRRHHGA